MVQRIELAHQLKKACPPADVADRYAIIDALERGESEGTILFMPEVFRWPATYHWLRERL